MTAAVGVVGNVRNGQPLDEPTDPDPQIYEPFLDQSQIESSTGVTFAVNKPTKDTTNNPILETDTSATWDYMKGYCTCVKRDGVFHLHYRAFPSTSPYTSYFCYATSADGITFTKPTIDRFTHAGGDVGNGLAAGNVASTVYDWRSQLWVTTSEEGGSSIFTSPTPDGWFTKVKELVWPSGFSEGRQTIRRPDGRWLCYFKVNGGDPGDRTMRVWLSDTAELAGAWTDMGNVLGPGGAEAQFYGVGVHRIADTFYGFTMRFNQTTDLIFFDLWHSRDGLTWAQASANWIPLGSGGEYDDSVLMNGSQWAVDGNDWHFYYAAQPEVHGSAAPVDIRIARVTIGADRVGQVSSTGTVTTEPMQPKDVSTLTVNCDASGGSIDIDVLDAAGDVLAGFAATNMTDITTDTYSTTPTWGGSLMPTGQPIKLRFNLTSATLHSYRIG